MPSHSLIQSQFSSVNYNYTRFDPKLLNDSAAAVNASIALNAHDVSPFVIASLRAWNATGTEDPNDPASTPTPIPSDRKGTANNGLAMTVLYVITGFVSALFLIVILTGVSTFMRIWPFPTHTRFQAVRAFRHPDLYGPRPHNPNNNGPDGEGQTRALGIARAVLDTFPVIKWGRNNSNTPQSPTEPKTPQGYDGANRASRSLEGAQCRESAGSKPFHRPLSGDGATITGSVRPGSTRRSRRSSVVDPTSIGQETCPICIVDFEEGDDVRVLPCLGEHRFHKECVDLWLLELSTSCPICRKGVFHNSVFRPFTHSDSDLDFQALENIAMAQGEDQALPLPDAEIAETATYPPHQQPTASWSAKYMHFVHRKRRSDGHRPPSETAGPSQ